MRKTLVLAALGLALPLVACAVQTKLFGAADVVELGDVTVAESEVEIGPAPAGTPGTLEVRGGDEEALRVLLGRALHYGGPEGGDTLVLVGELPADLPFDLPLPEGARVVGSVVRGEPFGTEVFLDVGLSPDGAIEFYRSELMGAGWSVPEQAGRERGFVSDPYPADETFCSGTTDGTLWISAFPAAGGTTDLRMNYHLSTDYSSCEVGYGPVSGDPLQRLMPRLDSPAGARILSGGMSSGMNEGDIWATLETELSALELQDYYERGLAEQGWEKVGEGAATTSAWSFWERDDEEGERWVGTLLLIENLALEHHRLAWFRIEQVD